MLEYVAKPADVGKRLDILVSGLYPQFTRSSLEILFDKKMIFVNNETAKASYKVRHQDAIEVDETYLKIEPDLLNLPVLYEDDDVMVIDKLAGILTHSKGALNLEPTVASFMKNKITDTKLIGNRAGIVHRLDRGTSGVIIAAKTQPALIWLQKQFSNRKVNKIYRAIINGIPQPLEALIDAPIDRNPKKPQTFKVAATGRSALTHYKVIKEFKNKGSEYSEVELQPQTGRTHQLRVHMAYIGHPIVGDNLYGRSDRPMLLHALSLELTLPNRARRLFTSPLPKSFKEFINNG